MYDQTIKAMYSLITKGRRLALPSDIQLKLFDSLVLPIVTYGCEIWGYSQCALAEKLHLKFCKSILKCKQSTPTFMFLGELGRYPVINYKKSRMVSFWAKQLIQKDLHHTANIMYSLMFNMQSRQDYRSEWLYAIQKIITDSGFNSFWIVQSLCKQYF